MKRALLIGGTGFAGWHLSRLLGTGYIVASVGSDCDIRDKKKVFALVEKVRPDVVVNKVNNSTKK